MDQAGDLSQSMGDVEHGDAASRERPHALEQSFGLALGERRCGLVEDEQSRLSCKARGR